jgi:outer membrane protein OmpA-like peptidoglycan-associated protein
MSFRIFTIGAVALACAVPAAAQQRGTVEFGAFGSLGSFDKALTLDRGMGGGGRVGVYLDPRWAIEFDKGEMRTTRTLGLKDVNTGILAARLVLTPIKSGALSILLGGGAGASTETNFMHSYGVNALLGAKIALNDNAALRADFINHWLANESWKSYRAIHLGLSLYRNPAQITKTVTVQAPPAPVMTPVCANNDAELARLRAIEAQYRALRDSLNKPAPVSSAAALATMEEKIHFATDKSDLTAESQAILDNKVALFRANPDMKIIIEGNTDERASDAYNMALGRRRSDAAKAYLVSKGIDAARIEVTSEGKRQPIAAGTTPDAQALNRRAEFRLLIASDFLVPPKP